MRRFDPRATFEPVHAAELEVEWWRAHRENQHGDHALGEALIVALRDLYAYEAGCDPRHPLRAEERTLLVRSYAALLVAVYR